MRFRLTPLKLLRLSQAPLRSQAPSLRIASAPLAAVEEAVAAREALAAEAIEVPAPNLSSIR